MKESRQHKIEAQLSAVEGELIALLSRSLLHTAEHGDYLFFNSQYHPEYVRPHQISELSESLYSLSLESQALREKVGLPILGSPGQLFISACREASNTANSNRRGPRQLASWLARELGPN